MIKSESGRTGKKYLFYKLVYNYMISQSLMLPPIVFDRFDLGKPPIDESSITATTATALRGVVASCVCSRIGKPRLLQIGAGERPR